MIQGVHTMFCTPQAEEARAFLRDRLGLPAYDVGGGWLVFEVPQADMGVHPSEGDTSHAVSFFTEDIEAAVARFRERGVEFAPIEDRGWGLAADFELPGGVKTTLFQPRYVKDCAVGVPDDPAVEMEALYHKMRKIQDRMAQLKRQMAKGAVTDYTLSTEQGPVTLSQLFAGKKDLLVIQNMGQRCSYCTLWADGLNGALAHLSDRAALVLCSPDEPAAQRAFASSRGWGFRMVSSVGSPFKRDFGFESDTGDQMPGVTAFHLEEGRVIHTASDFFGPGDSYCGVWHLFDLLAPGAGEWQPKFRYAGTGAQR